MRDLETREGGNVPWTTNPFYAYEASAGSIGGGSARAALCTPLAPDERGGISDVDEQLFRFLRAASSSHPSRYCSFLRLSRSSLLPKITSCKVSLIACRLACIHPPMDIHLLLVGEKKKKRRPMDGESYRDDVSMARSLRGFYRGTRKKLAFKWQRECFSGENISFERFFERRKRGGRGSEVVVGGDVTSVETKGDRREGEQRGVDKIARVVNR